MKVTIGQLVGIVVLLALIGLGGYYGTKQLANKSGKERQAVFLVNGQVYFGYVSGERSSTVTIRDVYYLQVQQNLQQGTQQNQNQQPQVSLVKLGNELHGPKDEMRINRDHILFVEDMKDDSKVNEAIANFIKNGPQATPTPTPAS